MNRAFTQCGIAMTALALALVSCSEDASVSEPDVAAAGAGAEREVARQSFALAVETPVLPVADTFVRKYDDDTNYGGASELRAEGDLFTSYQHGLVRVDSSGITTPSGWTRSKRPSSN